MVRIGSTTDAKSKAPVTTGVSRVTSKLFSFAPLSLFAAADAEGPHISLKAEPFYTVGNFVFTNSMVYGALLMVCLLIGAKFLGRRASVAPQRGVMALFEIMVSYVISLLEGVFGDRKRAVKFAPVFAVYFIVIMLSNLSGLLPIVGEGVTSGGIPAFRPLTADLNSVLALSVFSIVLVQIMSIRESGLKGHLTHYFSDKPKNPINLFVGVLEVLGELTRIISLSLRLFLNTVIGEILIAVFIDLSGPATPLTLIPIIAFEALVAYIQAYIFTVLSATYLALAVAHDDHHEEDHAATDKIAHSSSEPLTAAAE